MATHSSILAWRIPRIEEPGIGVAKSRTQATDFTSRCIYDRYISIHNQILFLLLF